MNGDARRSGIEPTVRAVGVAVVTFESYEWDDRDRFRILQAQISDSRPLHNMAPDDLSQTTRTALGYLWRTFERYCDLAGLPALPADPATVKAFLEAEHPRLAPSTLRRTLRAVGLRHGEAGHADPTADPAVREFAANLDELGGLLTDLGAIAVVEVADPVPHPDVLRMAAALGDDTVDLRDRALLLTGAAARLSKSALVSLRFGGVAEAERHVELTVEHRGAPKLHRLPRVAGLPDIPGAVRAWALAAGVERGFVFRSVDRWGHVSEGPMSAQGVGHVLKRAARLAGLPPERATARALTDRAVGG